MPNWRVHMEIAKRLNEKLNFNDEDLNLFLLGSIAPDINNGYIVKDVSKICDHGKTHLYKEEDHSTYTNFYSKYQNILETNPVAYGYFIHLYTDYLLNRDYEKKCCCNKWNEDECVKVKHKDLRIYDSKYINNTICLDDYQKAIQDLKQIEEISIDEQDIAKVINFLDKKEVSQNLNLEFYSYDELDKEVDDITNQIYKNFIDIY